MDMNVSLLNQAMIEEQMIRVVRQVRAAKEMRYLGRDRLSRDYFRKDRSEETMRKRVNTRPHTMASVGHALKRAQRWLRNQDGLDMKGAPRHVKEKIAILMTAHKGGVA